MKMFARFTLFVCLFLVLYMAFLAIFPNNSKTGAIFRKMTRYNLETGGRGQTLIRFRDIEETANIDLLFIGSSHTYRGFDPRIFFSQGYTSFNMGSTSQTPLNTYFLLKKYFTKLNPKLVVFEVYPVILSVDGIESYYDLVTNVPYDRNILEMALALKNPNAIHVLVKNFIDRAQKPLSKAEQKNTDKEIYIKGGYCETNKNNDQGASVQEKVVMPLKYQYEYIGKIIEFVKNNDANIILVTQPLTVELLDSINNYVDISRNVKEIADAAGIIYIDYNDKVRFDSKIDFYDNDHLSASGVKKFNELLLADMRTHNLVD